MSIDRILVSALLIAGLAGAAAAQGAGAGAGTGGGVGAGMGTGAGGVGGAGSGSGLSNPGSGFGGTGAPGVSGNNPFTVPFGYQSRSSNVQPTTPNSVQQEQMPGAFQPSLPNSVQQGQTPGAFPPGTPSTSGPSGGMPNSDVNGLPPSVVPNR